MVVTAGGYRQAGRDLKELNFRNRAHVADTIRNLLHVLPEIAHAMIKISTRRVIPDYKDFLPSDERRISRYPYISGDTEKPRGISGRTSGQLSRLRAKLK